MLNAHRRRIMQGTAAGGLVLLTVFFLARAWRGEASIHVEQTVLRAEVDRVVSGNKIKLESDEHLVYAGIRAPFQPEPLYEEAKRRNTELVFEKKVRLRFDQQERDAKGYLQAYVYVDGQFVNEALVREGLAYVRLTPTTKRYAKQLLAAQEDARKHKRGLWSQPPRAPETTYPADPKYGNFHRPSCEDARNIKPERLVTIKSPQQAFAEGFAPCAKCLP